MTETKENNIIGFFASFQMDESDKDSINGYLWNKGGLKEKLLHLKSSNYGKDLELILVKVKVNPIPYELEHLKIIESYSSKEKAIAVNIILKSKDFLKLSKSKQDKFFEQEIGNLLKEIGIRTKRKKLDFNSNQLIQDFGNCFN